MFVSKKLLLHMHSTTTTSLQTSSAPRTGFAIPAAALTPTVPRTTTRTRMQAYAGLMVLLYPVGTPAVFSWLLFRHRHSLVLEDREEKPELRSCADLWEPYKNDKYYYEVGAFDDAYDKGRGIVLR